MGQDLGDPTHSARNNRSPQSKGLQQDHRNTFMQRGQNKDIHHVDKIVRLFLMACKND
jgi:hypothetical protein